LRSSISIALLLLTSQFSPRVNKILRYVQKNKEHVLHPSSSPPPPPLPHLLYTFLIRDPQDSRHIFPMKFHAAAIFLLSATVSSVDANDRTKRLEHDDEGGLVGRKLQVKKGGKKGDKKRGKKDGMNGGKKGDCTNGATPIMACGIEILDPGRYVLDGDLNCGIGQDGIVINADDVHLDCQGNQIRGIGPYSVNSGIVVAGGSTHVTVSNCHASNFEVGLDAFRDNENELRWNDLTIRDSTFNNNVLDGISLEGGVNNPSFFTVIETTANGNGMNNFGTGIVTFNKVIGSIAKSTMNNNEYGFVVAGDFSTVSLVDVIANGNLFNGISSFSDSFVNVINSIACGNIDDDLFNAHTSQATTCDVSNPPTIDDMPACQCPCEGGVSGAGGASVTGGGTGPSSALSDSAAIRFPRPTPVIVSADGHHSVDANDFP
jgi:hypothetical protein